MSTGSGRRGAVRLASYATPIVLAALAGFLYLGGRGEDSARPAGSVQIVGSETMRPVVTACAEAFMSKHPQADVVVKGGGSGDGIAALLHGIADIGMLSRPLSNRERDYALARGIELSLVELARDGIAVIVHPSNPVVTLPLGQLRNIFTGRVRTWRELGGADTEILTFARAAGSGTAALFGERVLGEASYGTSVQPLPTNEAMVAAVAARPGAIGYTGLGALRGAGDRVTVVALRTEEPSGSVSPTSEAIRSGRYPLTRTLSLVAVGPAPGPVKAFLDFCASPGGQALMQRAGYVAIHPGTP
jgi:phosphate transport system substrate-binding protein